MPFKLFQQVSNPEQDFVSVIERLLKSSMTKLTVATGRKGLEIKVSLSFLHEAFPRDTDIDTGEGGHLILRYKASLWKPYIRGHYITK